MLSVFGPKRSTVVSGWPLAGDPLRQWHGFANPDIVFITKILQIIESVFEPRILEDQHTFDTVTKLCGVKTEHPDVTEMADGFPIGLHPKYINRSI